MNATNVITDRHQIAEIVNAGLAELDDLQAQFKETQQRVAEAQRAEEAAARVYASKIEEVLATGWATPHALAAQGHEVPKKRSPATRAKRNSAASATPEAHEPADGSDN